MKIKNKMMLRDRLNHGNYDVISIWNDGTWAEAGTGYGGEQDGHNPIARIHRTHMDEMTHAAITTIFRKIEHDNTEADI